MEYAKNNIYYGLRNLKLLGWTMSEPNNTTESTQTQHVPLGRTTLSFNKKL